MKKIKAMFPFLAVIALSHYLLPLLIIGSGTQIVILFAALPLICIVCSIAYGINNSRNLLYPVLVAFLAIISSIRFSHPWVLSVIFSLAYGIIALIGNAVGMVFYKRNVRIKHVEKYGKILGIAIIGSYFLAIIVSAIMMIQMTQIKYNTSRWMHIIREDIIDFKTNTAQRSYYDYNRELTKHEENTIGAEKKLEIKLVCVFSLFPIWHKNYIDPSIMDGEQYSIIRTYGNSESVVNGSNAYPLTYQLVMMTIDNALK